jgi:hypothetical protein
MKRINLSILISMCTLGIFAQTTGTYSFLNIVNSGNEVDLLRFSIDRPWVFRQANTGSSA